MSTTENTAAAVSPHYARAIARGCFYECPCGEVWDTIRGARQCRKCRKYLGEYSDLVVDIRTGEAVYGTDPRVIRAERERAEAREADLRAAAKRPSASLTCNPFAGRF